MKDPYKILGINKQASADEIKRAYRKKARKFHPDLHPNNDTAHEQMNEINEAYACIMNPDSDKCTWQREWATPGHSGEYYAYAVAYDIDTKEITQIADLINARSYEKAECLLMDIAENNRDARWHYMYALACLGMKKTVNAYNHIQMARKQSSNNIDYIRAENAINTYGKSYEEVMQAGGFSKSGIGSNLLCCLCLDPAVYSWVAKTTAGKSRTQ